MKDREFAANIAAAFQPGMADAVRIHEAIERAKLQAEMLGLDGDSLVDRAKFRYIASARSGTDSFIEMLGDLVQEEIRGQSAFPSAYNEPKEGADDAS